LGFWARLLPGVPSSQYPSFGTETRRLAKRAFDLSSIASSLTSVCDNAPVHPRRQPLAFYLGSL
jgi:hypothetical protein